MESVAAGRERQLAATTLMRNQEKVKQLMERFNSLMDEGKYHAAEEQAAVEAEKYSTPLNPNNPINTDTLLGKLNARRSLTIRTSRKWSRRGIKAWWTPSIKWRRPMSRLPTIRRSSIPMPNGGNK